MEDLDDIKMLSGARCEWVDRTGSGQGSMAEFCTHEDSGSIETEFLKIAVLLGDTMANRSQHFEGT